MDAPGVTEWRHTIGKNIDEEALQGGYEKNGEPLFVGRAQHDGFLIPGKVRQFEGVCYVPNDRAEHKYDVYQVLIGDPKAYDWVNAENGNVPPNAVIGGFGGNNNPIYIGRKKIDGGLILGKIYPPYQAFYYCHNSTENKTNVYQVLVKV